MSSNSKRETYIFPIDKHGDISAHVNNFIVSQESYARSIGQELLGVEGMRPYYLKLLILTNWNNKLSKLYIYITTIPMIVLLLLLILPITTIIVLASNDSTPLQNCSGSK